MRRRSVVSAPGKSILMGEHAVVYGHPALVCALDLRLTVRIDVRDTGGVRVDLPSLGAQEDTSWEEIGRVTESRRDAWRREMVAPGSTQTTGRDVDLVLVALGEAAASVPGVAPPSVHVRVSSELAVGAGFGSSAALALATGAALRALLEVPTTPGELHALSLETERRQHGTPSGVDSATSLHGGIVWARKDADGHVAFRPLPQAAAACGAIKVFNSGAPKETTGETVASVRRKMAEHEESVRAAFSTIAEATGRLAASLDTGALPPDVILETFRASERALEDLGVVPDAVALECRRLEDAGGAAKVSGAGALTGTGAGSILAFHPDADVLETWELPPQWTPLPARLGASGLRTEELS